jgi:hypothetical protein
MRWFGWWRISIDATANHVCMSWEGARVELRDVTGSN